MNILIIDDDNVLARNISDTFEKSGISNRIDTIYSYEEYLRVSNISYYDIILLDIHLEYNIRDAGFMILSHIRKFHTTIPIVMISSNDGYVYLEKAFQKWANDYIIKPFRTRELQIRIQRWFRNYIVDQYYFCDTKSISYRELEYNMEKNIFYYKSQEILLTKGNKYILLILLIHKWQIVSHDFLVWKIWGNISCIHKKNIRIKILRLKKQLELYDISGWIQNFHGEGYILRKSL